MAKYTQDNRAIAIATPLGKDVLLLKGFSMTEEMGRPFAVQLDLRSEKADVDFNKVIGENVTIRVNLTGGKVRYINGFVSRFSQEEAQGEGALNKYRATIVPWLWFLTRTSDCKIFQNKKIQDIVKQIFDDNDFADYEFRLTGTYQPKEYVVQYRETTFNFVSRLLEHEGMYYYFKHENGKHLMIITDSPAKHEPNEGYAEVKFVASEQAKIGFERIWDWETEKRIQPGKVALVDFDYRAPTKNLYAEKSDPRQHANAEFEVFDYPGQYIEHAHGESYAAIRNEELAVQHAVSKGVGDVRNITAGAKFKLVGYTRQDQNAEYVCVGASCSAAVDEFDTGGKGGGEQVFHVNFTAIPAAAQFRPSRTSAKPRVAGPQTAIVVGGSEDEICTDPDEFGRVKVHFHWDRHAKPDDSASCWVRVSQNWAGKRWGVFFLPRVGQEVIVDFLEGDPDQPIITGRVYNKENMPPYKLPDFKTMSTIKSNSSKGGGGFNELRFEDKKGEEQIFIHAERQMDIRVKKNCYEWIGEERHLIVIKDQKEKVGGARGSTIGGDDSRSVGGDDNHKIKGSQKVAIEGSASYEITGDWVAAAEGKFGATATGDLLLKGQKVVIVGPSGITLKCGGSSVVIDSAGVTLKGPTITLDGNMVKIASGPGSSPASGNASTEAPGAPAAPDEADLADPGEMAKVKAEQKKTGKGKYGKQKIDEPKKSEPGKEDPPKKEPTWFEFQLVDDEDAPVKQEKTKVELAPGGPKDLRTDDKGIAKAESEDKADAKATYPDREDDEWDEHTVVDVEE